MDVLKELNMTPSRAHVGKGPRDEREYLRYKAHIGEIKHPSGGWKWEDEDDELAEVRHAMKSFKEGKRAPSGWRKLPKVNKTPPANDVEPDAPNSRGEEECAAEPNKRRSSNDAADKTMKKPRKVKSELTSNKDADDTEIKKEPYGSNKPPPANEVKPDMPHSRGEEESAAEPNNKRRSNSKTAADKTTKKPRTVKSEYTSTTTDGTEIKNEFDQPASIKPT